MRSKAQTAATALKIANDDLAPKAEPEPGPSHRELALSYAGQGVYVFPCNFQKRPHIQNWNKCATADADQVRRLWNQFPDALVGLPCGPNNLMAVDIDRHKGGPDGLTSIFSL